MMRSSLTDGFSRQSPARPEQLRGRLRATFLRWAVGQFRRPSGFWGHVAGWIMARRPSNVLRNRWTVELLEIQPDDRVLEIGFGPGVAIASVVERLGTGRVVGVDHSRIMLRQAARRNRQGIAHGRVRLRLGSIADVPADAGPFDKVLAVNLVMFWDDPVAGLRAVRERLAAGGRIALTTQPRALNATDADALRAGERLCAYLRDAGFRNVRLNVKPMQPVAAVCALAER